MRELIEGRLLEGTVNRADTAFADLLVTLAAKPCDTLWGAAVLASAAVQNGDVCVQLSDVLDDRHELGKVRAELLDTGVMQVAQTDLESERYSETDGENSSKELPMPTLPLVIDSANRIYLARYWQEERDLAIDLKRRLVRLSEADAPMPATELLDTLFPTDLAATSPDWQRVAAVTASRQRICIITGGPGTGKTRTVARLLAVLQSSVDNAFRIALVAPTGKAAARLLESLRIEVDILQEEGVVLELPSEASTLHRALGYQPGRRGFRHNADNPLPFDVVLVDEASMVDLSMQYSLVSALGPTARLILLGDRDQLASVDAGNVLGDIVGDSSPERYSKIQCEALAATCPGFETVDQENYTGGMADAIVQLQHSYRFGSNSGIGQFAKAVNKGDADAACAIGDDKAFEDIVFVDPSVVALSDQLKAQALPAALAVLACDTVVDALSALLRSRVLCAVRTGPRGVSHVNWFLENQLMQQGYVLPTQPWYRGRPLLITRNDRSTGLYNGDTGLIWPDEHGNPMAWFPDGKGIARAVSPGRLPAHETSYAMTVHKTQGSEFTNVLLVLPEPPHALLSRDLLYTGITRAKESVAIHGSVASIRTATQTKRLRASGLRERLWSEDARN